SSPRGREEPRASSSTGSTPVKTFARSASRLSGAARKISPTTSLNEREERIGRGKSLRLTRSGDRLGLPWLYSEMRLKMVGVEFRNVGPGTCSWCGKAKAEVFTVVFSDRSFDGPMELCPNDFRCAIRVKVRGAAKSPATRVASSTGGNA